MEIVSNIASLRAKITKLKSNGTVCFVPTMGYLHDGHLALVKFASKKFDYVVVSIFVNPAQFSKGEDYFVYPKDLSGDSDKCLKSGVDVLYMPSVEEMYPENFFVHIDIGERAKEMCGKSRENYFNGIMLVVGKLVSQVNPDAIVFGEKDYQMFFLIKKFLYDMNFFVDVLCCKTIREIDGLAFSSRNVYLSKEDRVKAPLVYKILCDIHGKILKGTKICDAIKFGENFLLENGFNLDYLECRTNEQLVVANTFDADIRIFCAVKIGKCRLIDNILVEFYEYNKIS